MLIPAIKWHEVILVDDNDEDEVAERGGDVPAEIHSSDSLENSCLVEQGGENGVQQHSIQYQQETPTINHCMKLWQSI